MTPGLRVTVKATGLCAWLAIACATAAAQDAPPKRAPDARPPAAADSRARIETAADSQATLCAETPPPGNEQAPGAELPAFIPPVTDADRAAAFPDVMGHSVHDSDINYFVLLDQLEWHPAEGPDGLDWDARGWIGKDRDRFWFRTEGVSDLGQVRDAHTHLLYGRALSRWWDVVAGIRQDVRPGSPQTWASVGIQGLAPYWFEVQATANVGGSWRTQLRLEAEYELLLTNRWILQPLVEVGIYGKADPSRDIGAGLSSVDAGLRLRYLVRREFAPYVGVTWNWKFFGTKDLARESGAPTSLTRLALGVRLWL
jgi:copper resistance protein B